MKILGIETSCDETAMSLIEFNPQSNQFKVLANFIHSQISIHKEFGGVVPNLAKREHIVNLPIILSQIKKKAQIEKLEKPDLIAVTKGPGLEPALWTGIEFAKKLSHEWKIDLIPINHMEGHIVGSLIPQNIFREENNVFSLKNISFPSLALLISGGHTELVLIKSIGKYEVIGKTRDDALGEAFDKIARLLGFEYPGGPEISKLSKNFSDFENKSIKLPRPMINSGNYDFSFSGIKTAVLYLIKKIKEKNSQNLNQKDKEEIAYEFEEAVSDVLIHKTSEAIKEFGIKDLILGGGVVANEKIRSKFEKNCNELNINLHLPDIKISGDNALMIAIAGSLHLKNTSDSIKAEGNLNLKS